MKLHSGDRKDIGEARVQSASRQGKESERMGWWWVGAWNAEI